MRWTVQEIISSQQAGEFIERGIKERKPITRKFKATHGFKPTGKVNPLSAPGVPGLNSCHPKNPILRARRFNVQKVGPKSYTVTVAYEVLLMGHVELATPTRPPKSSK